MPSQDSVITRPLVGFSEICEQFDLCLCDIWGVVHNGVAAHRGAVEALLAMRQRGVTVVLVTNAPRPGDANEIARQVSAKVAESSKASLRGAFSDNA